MSAVTESTAVSGDRRGLAASKSTIRARLALALICLIGLAAVSGGLFDEGGVALDGDMPHYLLNGVFIRDFVRALPRSPIQYAQHYYARYPALSLGHHPILPALIEAPFFALFGVSVLSARLSTVCALLLAVAFWFQLVREIYDTPTAFFASLLFISTPGVIPLFQVVLSEPFALCLVIMSVYLMHRSCATERPAYAVAFAVTAVLSLYAKQLAIFLFPVYAFQFFSVLGFRKLLRRPILLGGAVIALCLVPLALLTLKYAKFNIMIVTQFVTVDRVSGSNMARFGRGLWNGQLRLTLPLLAMATISTIGACLRRDARIALFIVWIGMVYVGLTAVGVNNDRFFCYWLPAFSAVTAAALQVRSGTAWRGLCSALLILVLGYQAWMLKRDLGAPSRDAFRIAGATGYEEAARYVTENRRGDVVLYSAAVDTGYFIFFVRKHDPDREMVVLRADKTFTTSRMRISDFERRITSPEEILPILDRYGVGHIVIEDRSYPEGPLRWLQQIVHAPEFELERRIGIVSTDVRLDKATLSVYGYRRRVPADPDAMLSIRVPVINDVIRVRLADLTRRGVKD